MGYISARLHDKRHRHEEYRVHHRVYLVVGTASRASGLGFMSAQRMTRELRRILAGVDRIRVSRRWRLAAALVVLAVPLGGCGTGSLWDKFLAKDDTFVEEPADKLYNEGLYLMN